MVGQHTVGAAMSSAAAWRSALCGRWVARGGADRGQLSGLEAGINRDGAKGWAGVEGARGPLSMHVRVKDSRKEGEDGERRRAQETSGP